jgi:hypothetical protein
VKEFGRTMMRDHHMLRRKGRTWRRRTTSPPRCRLVIRSRRRQSA